MNADKTYVFHEDAGHGWLAVKRYELKELGILDKVSSFSHEQGDSVYLEEDCDAALFINTLKEKGVAFKYRDHIHPDLSPIRTYKRFSLKKGE